MPVSFSMNASDVAPGSGQSRGTAAFSVPMDQFPVRQFKPRVEIGLTLMGVVPDMSCPKLATHVRFGSKKQTCAALRPMSATAKSGLTYAPQQMGRLFHNLIGAVRRNSTESPSRHWHYLHHLHGSLWHG